MKNVRLMTLLVMAFFTLTANGQEEEMIRRVEVLLREGGDASPFMKTNYDSLLIIFKTTADDYQLFITKPAMSEEQRKLIIQANLCYEQKSFKAIALYNQAIDLNPTSYPVAYFNLAFIYAQLNIYNAAIFNMKKYLMLVPNAEDARAAQDKIYEWEARVVK